MWVFSKLLILCLIYNVLCERQLFNSSHICEGSCKCESGATFTLDCSRNQQIDHTLTNWPELPQNATELIAIFSYNNLTRLESMPPTNLSLAIFYDHCGIRELGTGLFENCPNVTHLDLSYNSIKGDQLHSDVFKGPYSNDQFDHLELQHLDLSYNRIHTLERKCFEHMLKLKWLNLEGNEFRYIDIPTTVSLSLLTQLEVLNVANNRLISMPPELLKPMKKLIKLDLSKNDYDFVTVAIHNGSKSLRTLIIDSNPIVAFTDETFLGMEALVTISARNLVMLEEIKTNAFAPLKMLHSLNLSGMNSSADIAEEAFGSIANLRELNMSWSGLQYVPVNMVNWSELSVLDLRGNSFYCECSLLNITKRLPKHIIREPDGPYCYDRRRFTQSRLYELNEDACFNSDNYNYNSYGSTFGDARILRMSLLMLSVMLTVVTAAGMWLGYTKYLRARRNRAYPFANSVIYNPVTTDAHLLS